VPELTVRRKGYTRKDGTRVAPTTFKIKDRGEPGRTPEAEQWFEPKVHSGWKKGQPQSVRRAKVLKAHKGDELASAWSMQALANVSTDRDTAKKASEDADYFYMLLHRRRAPVSQRIPRITPKTPRIR